MSNHLYDHLLGQHGASPAPFLIRPGQPTLSFADTASLAARLAHALVDAGLTPGDRVVVQAPKSAEMVALYLGTLRAGGVFLPLNTGYTADEVAYFVTDARPRVIICDPSSEATFAPLASAEGATLLTLDAAGQGSLTQTLDSHPDTFDTVPRAPGDLAALLYTSGTTGRSKGAMVTHDNLLSNARTLTDAWRMTAADRLIHALPIFHTHGLFVALNTALLAGMAVEFLPGFDADAIIEAMPGATMLMGVPTFYTRLLADPRLTPERTSNMRLFISGSAPLLTDTHRAFTARTGHRILERYGMTETNMITSNPYEGDRRPGTVGPALPGVELCVTDPDTGAPLPQGEVGMVELRGPNVFKGYWQMPEKTAAELRDTGFFITGDLGQLSADGYLTIVGRSKDLIITGGYNVYPKEVEDILNAVPGVVETAVFGVPDADFGEAIIAAVVVDPDDPATPESLARAVQDKLARFKHPRRYDVLANLPRNTMGKVQKALLRDRAAPPDAPTKGPAR